jgi:polar amino acid transport system substrate-binding protein
MMTLPFSNAILLIPRSRIWIWIRRASIIFAALVLFWAGYRACRWIVPKPPEIYKIGVDATWYPLSLYGREYSFTAFSSDLLFAIARNQHIKVEIVRTGPKRLIDLLEDGHVQAVLSSIAPDDHNKEKYYFSDPYYRLGAILVMRKDYDFHSLQSLHNARIGVKRESAVLYRISIDPSVTIVPYDSPLIALDDLGKGEIDGIVTDVLAYLYFGGLYREKLKVVTLPLTNEGLRMITLQEMFAGDLIVKFNQGLKNLKDDGVYEELLSHWELYNPEKIE